MSLHRHRDDNGKTWRVVDLASREFWSRRGRTPTPVSSELIDATAAGYAAYLCACDAPIYGRGRAAEHGKVER